MALNPDRPVGRRQQAPPPEALLTAPVAPIELEIDRAVESVYARTRERAAHAVDAREQEGRMRSMMGTIPENIHDLAPRWSRPLVRGLLKRLTGIGQGITYEFANFPFIGRPVSAFFRRHNNEPGQAVGRQEARSFYSMLVHHEIFKAFKQEAREGRILTPADRERIQSQIVAEQPHDPQEVVRQERTLEEFNRALERGEYTTAAQIYDRVLERKDWRADIISDVRAEKLKRELARNKARKPANRLSQEAIERSLSPEKADENLWRNELLQKYLRVAASRHIADMVEGGVENPQARFLVMFQNFWPIEKLSRDDIPLDDSKITEFFGDLSGTVHSSITSALERRQARQNAGEAGGVIGDAHTATLRRRVQTALRLGILTTDDLRSIPPDIDPGRHLTEEGAAVSPIARDRVERAFMIPEWEGIIFPQTVPASEEIYSGTVERLRAAWQRDIANDNDEYSNFDNERARTLERIDIFSRQQVVLRKTEKDERTGKMVERTVELDEAFVERALNKIRQTRDEEMAKIQRAIQQQQGADEDEEFIHQIMVAKDRTRRTYAQRRADILAPTSIMTPGEIAHEIMGEDFRDAVMNRLISAFNQDDTKFSHQRAAVSRVRDETYAPYRILSDSEMDDVREIIRMGPARERLVRATLRGEPVLNMEEDALEKLGIFTREELEDRRNAIAQLIGARRAGLPENVISNFEEQFIQMGILTKEELDQLRPEIERRVQEV